MKLAVISSGPALDDRMEARFGRCPYFILIDPDTLAFEVVENPNVGLSGGAGIQSAQLMAEKGVTVVMTGNCGPNAFQVFGAAGIQVITGVDGTVKEAVEKYKSGSLSSTAAPTVGSHFGMGDSGVPSAGAAMPTNSGMPKSGGIPGGTGARRNMGSGMGRGMGGGRGCRRDRGMGGGMALQGPENGGSSIKTVGSREEEMRLLKQSAEDLRLQFENIENRIKEITKDH